LEHGPSARLPRCSGSPRISSGTHSMNLFPTSECWDGSARPDPGKCHDAALADHHSTEREESIDPCGTTVLQQQTISLERLNRLAHAGRCKCLCSAKHTTRMSDVKVYIPHQAATGRLVQCACRHRRSKLRVTGSKTMEGHKRET
jgi:hypothetical protein